MKRRFTFLCLVLLAFVSTRIALAAQADDKWTLHAGCTYRMLDSKPKPNYFYKVGISVEYGFAYYVAVEKYQQMFRQEIFHTGYDAFILKSGLKHFFSSPQLLRCNKTNVPIYRFYKGLPTPFVLDDAFPNVRYHVIIHKDVYRNTYARTIHAATFETRSKGLDENMNDFPNSMAHLRLKAECWWVKKHKNAKLTCRQDDELVSYSANIRLGDAMFVAPLPQERWH